MHRLLIYVKIPNNKIICKCPTNYGGKYCEIHLTEFYSKSNYENEPQSISQKIILVILLNFLVLLIVICIAIVLPLCSKIKRLNNTVKLHYEQSSLARFCTSTINEIYHTPNTFNFYDEMNFNMPICDDIVCYEDLNGIYRDCSLTIYSEPLLYSSTGSK
ncbi:hypothetical protein HZS_568 [Henneguya salminicola]|nr:hypothetical protein HZS_568 [Henneguya salminicola]